MEIDSQTLAPHPSRNATPSAALSDVATRRTAANGAPEHDSLETHASKAAAEPPHWRKLELEPPKMGAGLNFLSNHFGRSGADRIVDARRFMKSLSDKPEALQVYHVNRYLNQTVRYLSDSELWKVEDYWATPTELFGRGEGDCEDYALAKYDALRKLGVPDERLRLVYVKVIATDTAHMVLSYRPLGATDPLILDNLIREAIPLSSRHDFIEVMSFNSDSLWRGHNEPRLSDASRLDRWVAYQERLLEREAL